MRGDVVVVPPGVPHTLWNPGEAAVRLVVEFRPALRMEYLFETIFGLARSRRTRTPLLDLLRVIVRTRAYRDEFGLPWPRFLEKRRVTTALARYAVNPLVKAAFMLGVAPPGYALLETTGRKSGVPRRTPVGYAREDDVVWLVAEHGRRAGWVRNIEATPRVRVKLGKRWYNGSAHAMPDDDARKRLGEVGTTLSRATVRVLATDLLTVRVALR